MRTFPFITAILVMAFLYMLVFQRDSLLQFAAGRDGVGARSAAAAVDATTLDATTVDATASDLAEAVLPAGERAVSVVVLKSQSREIAGAVLLRGRTEAARQVNVRAETSGLVVSDPLRKGAAVTAGQLLCQLSPGTSQISLDSARARLAEAEARVPEAEARLPEARARLAEAQARLAEADINLRAAERLSVDGFASETRVASANAANQSAAAAVQAANSGVAASEAGIQSASAAVRSAQSGIAAAEREIDLLSIKAPFGGILESDAAETGSLLQPGALCATVIQLDPIKLVGFVPETEVAKVTVGVPAGARLAAGGDVAGTVTFLSRSADPATRTFRVEIQVPNTDLAIRDGQTAEILISSAAQAAHLLPQSSLTLNDEGALGVRIVNDNSRVEFVAVTVLRDTRDGIFVTGLPERADVIVVGQEFVVQGVPVKVAYR
ncbi:MAG: efflux RND transporter periplasmic adaptor subunit, partial [Paracoccaceae bacterium]